MSKSDRRIVLALAGGALALGLLAGGDAAAQARLELRLAAPESVPLGAPLSVRVELVNLGSGPATVFRNLAPEFDAVRYAVTGPGHDGPFVPWAIKEPAEPMTELAPGAALVEEVELFYGGEGWLLREPGRYTIAATYADLVAAAPVVVTVAAPRDEAERQAARAILDEPEAGRFLLLRGGEHLQAGRAAVLRAAELAPRSAPGAAANLALGVERLRPARDFASGAVRAADPGAALAFLDRVEERALGLSGLLETRLARATGLRGLGREGEAVAVERELPALVQERFPGLSPELLRDRLVPQTRRRLPPG